MVMQPARQHMSFEQYLLLVVSLDIEIEVCQLYRRLSIPAVIEQIEEENELNND